jgi:uncharacterized protein (DUF697 family)/GTP-binding protein EngB required for normal cell division
MLPSGIEANFAKILQDQLESVIKNRGRVNILVAGRTGVGKSTLINAVFQGELATTGQGRPVTMQTREIFKEGIPLSIFDTRGLEVKEYANIIQSLEKLIQERSHDEDPDRHIHAAWVCIVEDSARVEDAEIHLSEMLANYVPVVAVITKAKADGGFRQKVQDLLPEARNAVRVRALETTLDDGYILKPMGLEDLVEVTMEVVPEGRRNAFAAAQRVSLKQKVNRSHTVVVSAATVAAGIGAMPIPFADAALIIPVQISMLAGISAVWGLPLSTAFVGTLISGAVTGSAGTILGRAAVGALFKLIPGAGSVVGGTINASTASLLTTAFGEAYITSLSFLMKNNPDRLPTPQEIVTAFKNQLRLQRKLT